MTVDCSRRVRGCHDPRVCFGQGTVFSLTCVVTCCRLQCESVICHLVLMQKHGFSRAAWLLDWRNQQVSEDEEHGLAILIDCGLSEEPRQTSLILFSLLGRYYHLRCVSV